MLPPHVEAIQEAIQQTGTHHHAAFEALEWRVMQQDLSVYGSGINRYNRSYLAQEVAFLSLMSQQPKVQKQFAQMAFEAIKGIYETPEQERLPHTGYGLSRAMMQQALAFPYAWCGGHWSKSQRKYVEGKMAEALDAWLTYDHANFWNEKGSNWVAVCRGGELILLLAAGEKEQRKERYDFLIEQLSTHMRHGYGSLGVSQEGMGYTEYGGQFLLKAIVAAASMGDSTLFQQAQNHSWWKLAMYAESFQPHSRKFLMTGVAGTSGPDEGWASLLFNIVPPSHLPHFQWWYDRHMGQLAPGSIQDQFDSNRAGTIWSVLYYPLGITAEDPTGTYPASFRDDHGYYFFRNRWKDENDILFSIMADSHHHGNAWDQPEVFALNLMAHNSRYIGGPSKERKDSLYSTLLVDGRYNIEGSVRLTGKEVKWDSKQNAAFATIDGGQLYDSLGVGFAQRICAVKFLPDNRAIIALMDTLESLGSHRYTWQLNLGDEQTSDSVAVQVDGHRFQLKGRNGQVDGWVVAPSSAKILPKTDPFQIEVEADSTRIMVIMHVHSGESVQLLHQPQDNRVDFYDLGEERIWYDPKTGWMVVR